MKRNKHFFDELCKGFSWIASLVFLFVLINSCTTKIPPFHPVYPIEPAATQRLYQPQKQKWLDWNVLFLPGTGEIRRIQTLDSIKKYVDNYLAHSTNPTFQVTQFYFSCPCDSGLINYTATPLAGMSGAPNPPPQPGKGVGGSGDGIEYVNNNNSFLVDTLDDYQDAADKSKPITLNTSGLDSRIFAVMDTGLDTLFFQRHFEGLLWSIPGAVTLRNFQFFKNSQPYDYFLDEEKHKHGTAVTALALRALEKFNDQNHVKPHFMILKVLDENKQGSTFTVSCALSYAIQNHATIINASLGYYGVMDSILLKYAGLTRIEGQDTITIFSAAGNIQSRHDQNILCKTPGNGNLLDDNRLVYPACFSDSFSNFITVTGLSSSTTPCLYQNFSSKYVNVGVATNPGSAICCKFLIPFLNKGAEGSSFSTPVVSGEVMGCLISTPGSTIQSCLDLISPVPSPIPNNPAIKQGRFLTYTSP